jgi:hypothetical protein
MWGLLVGALVSLTPSRGVAHSHEDDRHHDHGGHRGEPPVSESGQPAAGGRITVVSATYGANCKQPEGNVTPKLAEVCDGTNSCAYRIDYTVIGDPAPGCKKNFVAKWKCHERDRRIHSSPRPGSAPT